MGKFQDVVNQAFGLGSSSSSSGSGGGGFFADDRKDKSKKEKTRDRLRTEEDKMTRDEKKRAWKPVKPVKPPPETPPETRGPSARNGWGLW
jgi:hypothetical protein